MSSTPPPEQPAVVPGQNTHGQMPSEGVITVDTEQDTSSDYGSSLDGSELTSLKSSIMNYVFENGRRYHAHGSEKDMLPNDETAQDNLDLHHHIYLLLLNGNLSLAPLKPDMQRVLDLGTGTGIWAIDCADTYPSAEVIGADLSPIQPSWVPPNCTFEVDDIENEWVWQKNHFDFIHSRNLTQSIRDWPRYVSQMYEHTKPGGYVELIEIEPTLKCDDGSVPPKAAVFRYYELFAEAAKKNSLPQPTGDDLKKLLEEAGFVDIELRTIKQPVGTWAKDERLKDIGRFFLIFMEKAFHTYALALFTRTLGMSADDANKLCDAAKNDVFNKRHHLFNNLWFVIGRKPENNE